MDPPHDLEEGDPRFERRGHNQVYHFDADQDFAQPVNQHYVTGNHFDDMTNYGHNEHTNSSTQVVKCVVVGDSGVGKTRMICNHTMATSYTLQQLSTSRVPSVWAIDQYRKCEKVRERSHTTVDDIDTVLQIWDTFGYHDKNRKFAYGSADVVLICFSVVRPHTYANVLNHWYPEVKRICGNNIPVVLVGTQIDLRYMYKDPEFVAINKGSFFKEIAADDIMFPDKGQQLASEIGATYYETSVLVPYGVQCTFTNCIRAALCARRSKHLFRLLGSSSSLTKHLTPPTVQRPFLPPRPLQPNVSPPTPVASWLQPAWTACQNGLHCDVKFCFQDGVVVAAHRALLVCMCPAFRRFFLHRKNLALFTLDNQSNRSDQHAREVHLNDKPKAAENLAQSSQAGQPAASNTLPRSSPHLYSSPVSRCSLAVRCPTQHLPAVDVVLVNSSVQSDVFLCLLRYLYTDVYAGNHPAALHLLAGNLFLHDFAVKISNSAQQVDHEVEAASSKARHVMRINNYNTLLLENLIFADVEFQLDNGFVPCHKFLLTSYCPMMHRMFALTQFEESKTTRVNFPGITVDTFSLFLRFCYLRQLTPWTSDQQLGQGRAPLTVCDPVELVALADELCLGELMSAVESVVAGQMNCRDEYVCEAAMLYDPLKFNNGHRLAAWCLWYLCVNYSSLFAGHRKVLSSMPAQRQQHLKENRWPPVWYLKAFDVYEKSKIQKPEVLPYKPRLRFHRKLSKQLCIKKPRFTCSIDPRRSA